MCLPSVCASKVYACCMSIYIYAKWFVSLSFRSGGVALLSTAQPKSVVDYMGHFLRDSRGTNLMQT